MNALESWAEAVFGKRGKGAPKALMNKNIDRDMITHHGEQQQSIHDGCSQALMEGRNSYEDDDSCSSSESGDLIARMIREADAADRDASYDGLWSAVAKSCK